MIRRAEKIGDCMRKQSPVDPKKAEALKDKKTNIPNLRRIRRSWLWGVLCPLIATEN